VYTHEATVGTPLTIGGVSKGAPSVIEALRRLEADRENTTDGKEPPSPDQMNVMIYGAPSRIYYAGVRYRPDLPVTPYDVVLVSAEYDGVADMPDNLFNVLAVLNAIQGADMLHVDAAFNTDFVNDPMHYKVETNKDGGKVTTVIIPYTDPIVPLLHPMLEAGADPVQLAKLSAILKPIIDAGYTRNNPIQKKKWTDGVITIPLPRAATSGSATGTPTTETSTTASSTTTSSTTTRSIASGGGSDSSSSGSGSVQALTVEKPADTAEPVEKPADTATKKTTKKTSSLNASKDSEDRRADSVTRIAKRLGQRITNRLGRDKSGASAGAASSSSGSTGSDSGASGGSSDQGD
jgi:hypothetical protein